MSGNRSSWVHRDLSGLPLLLLRLGAVAFMLAVGIGIPELLKWLAR